MVCVSKISVIVPVYNVEQYIDRCIRSIVEQSYVELEIILVDDGSQDNCPEKCDLWAKKDKRIKVVHKANGGLSDARNAGMAIAKGEYIAFVDSDDWIAPNMMEKLLDAIEKDKSDIAACTVEMVWENNAKSRLYTVNINTVLSREEAQEALLKETLLKQPVWYKLYKKAFVEDILFEVGKYHEDVFWSYQAVGRANRVSLINVVGYYYYQRSDSIMGEGYSLKRMDALEAIEKRYIYIQREFPFLEREARLSILSNCIYHGQMVMRYLKGKDKRNAFEKLVIIKNRFRFYRRDYQYEELQRRLWFDFARFSLSFACWVRNILNIGF